MKFELFLFYVFIIITIITSGMTVCHLSGFCKFKIYDNWLAPMTLAITLSMWENINK